MNINEVATYLGWRRDDVRGAASEGVALPRSGGKVILVSTMIGGELAFEEADLDAFIGKFEAEDPGRHPPVAVRRTLLVETGHRCAVCRDRAPIQYHHIIEFSRLRHHDPAHMLPLCGTCHSMCTVGRIDTVAQRQYKARAANLLTGVGFVSAQGLSASEPLRFSWDDLRAIVGGFHETVNAKMSGNLSRFDFSGVEIEDKNRINRLGDDYYAMIRDHHEPFFGRITAFLEDPVNEKIADKYYEVVDELRAKIAASRNKFEYFEEILVRFGDLAVEHCGEELGKRQRVLRVVLSFMYFNCDIGRKS